MSAHGTLVAFFIPGNLDNPLNGTHGHWSTPARRRKAWRENTKAAYLASPRMATAPWTPKRVTLVANVWNRMDSDGLQAACKSVRDGLVDCGLIDDDGPDSGHVFLYEQRVARAQRGVTVSVETL